MQVQKALEGEKYVTLSLAVAAPEGAVKKIATAMLTQFNQRFGDGRVETLHVKMVLAAALDPRTKQLAGIPAEQHNMVYTELCAMLLA
eukprot:14575-Heterococcus_DN1.PRE.1